MRRIRRHLTYANVISTLCLFLLLGGGTAVALTGTDTVQSDDLGPGAQVKAPDVADNAVNSADVVNNSLVSADLAPAARGARAYGRVSANGGFSRTKNLLALGHRPGQGIYCIQLRGIDPATAVLVVGPDYSNNTTSAVSDDVSVVEWDSTGADCSGDLEVRTFSYRGDHNDNNDGTGTLAGDDLVQSDEAFSYVVP
jgi:hypothetical protein